MHKVNLLKSIFALVLMLSASVSAQQKVMLDNYYNNEISTKTNQAFHYIWEDKAFSGFSQLGEIFTHQGATLATLKEKPNCKNLKAADVYIIVDPDHEEDSKTPNFMDKKAASAVVK